MTVEIPKKHNFVKNMKNIQFYVDKREKVMD